jgi:hypothetical protein
VQDIRANGQTAQEIRDIERFHDIRNPCTDLFFLLDRFFSAHSERAVWFLARISGRLSTTRPSMVRDDFGNGREREICGLE